MRRSFCWHNVHDPAFMRRVKRTLSAYKDAMNHSDRKGLSREAFVDIGEKGPAWFLGHMQLASQTLNEKVKDADFVLEIRDARLPFCTENPNLRKMAVGKPKLIIFNKAELANEDCNNIIQQYYEGTGNFVLFTSAKRSWKDTVEAVQRFVTHILPSQRYRTTAYVGLVVGMPNVGKSTLINSLRMAHEYQFHSEDFRRSRSPETVSIVPGTTQGVKLVPVSRDPNIVLYDSPGLTLPGCFSREAGMKLAACGMIPTNNLTLSCSLVSRFIYDVLSAAGLGEHIAECLHLPRAPISFDDCIAMICERSGTSGQTDLGNLDPARAQRYLIHDFQLGRMGRITLERIPSKIRRWANRNTGQEFHQLTSGEAGERENSHDDPNDFVWTHHVESKDVVSRYPSNMRDVMDKLHGPSSKSTSKGSSTVDNTVISRKKGPISQVTVFDEEFKRNVRFAPSR